MMNDKSSRDIYADLIIWASERRQIRAMLLTSSRAIPGAPVDALSDYDVILIVEDIHPFVSERSWLNDFGDILVVYWDPLIPDSTFGIEKCSNVTQYADGLKIDFTLWPVSLFQKIAAAPVLAAELDAGYQVLLDKDRLAAALRPPTFTAYIPKPPTLTAYLTHINDFLSDAPYVAKCLWRDELMPAKWCLDYDMKHIYLRQMLEWRIEIEHEWSIPVGFLGKGLKSHLSNDLWSQLEQTYAGAQLADNWDALAKTMTLFRQVAIEVGEQLGFSYPEDLHERVEGYVIHIKQLPPRAGRTKSYPQ